MYASQRLSRDFRMISSTGMSSEGRRTSARCHRPLLSSAGGKTRMDVGSKSCKVLPFYGPSRQNEDPQPSHNGHTVQIVLAGITKTLAAAAGEPGVAGSPSSKDRHFLPYRARAATPGKTADKPMQVETASTNHGCVPITLSLHCRLLAGR